MQQRRTAQGSQDVFSSLKQQLQHDGNDKRTPTVPGWSLTPESLYTNSPVRYYLLTTLIFMSVLPVSARNCTPLSKTNHKGYDFIAAYIETLESIKLASDALNKQRENLGRTKEDGVGVSMDMMLGLKQATEEYECAATLIRTFKTSKDPIIAKSATAMDVMYGAFIMGNNKMIQLIKDVLDGKQGMGSFAESISEHQVQRDELFRLMIQTTSFAMMPLMAVTKTASDNVQQLTITRKRHQTLMKELERIHGLEIKQGFKAGLLLQSGPAYLLYSTLGKEWEFAPEQ